MIQKFNMPKYLDDKDSDFNDFASVASNQVDNYEEKYRAMMRYEVKKKDPVVFKIHKKKKKSPESSPRTYGRAQFRGQS